MTIDVNAMPKLGFGLMRLPERDGNVVMEEVCRMVDAYLDAGFNYFDTAYVYHGGKSESIAKEAIVKRYPRESFYLATKLPAWSIKKPEDRDRIFNEQLERAGVTYFDFYLLHAVEDGGHYDTYEKFDCFNWAVQKKAEGKIKHFGFSYHGTPELLEEVLDKHPETEFVQIQLNYADWNHPVVRSGEIYEILHKRNIPIIIMEPVKGGTLASLAPELEAKFKTAKPDASIASWAFRFAASLPGVMTILSGMSNEEQMDDNIKTFTNFEPLSENEKAVVEDVTKTMLGTKQIGCTACKYCCDGCPMKISIPDVFRAVNTLRMYKDESAPKNFYNGLVQRSARASACVACGQCEGVCPQHLPIIELMKEASVLFDVPIVKEKVQEMISASSCCAALKEVGQAWRDAVGTDKEAAATRNLLAEIDEDIMPIDGLIEFAGSEKCIQLFGEKGAADMLAHGKEIKAKGAVYCDCLACVRAVEVKNLLK